MRILIIDIEGLGLDFALRCEAADHEVRWFKFVEPGKRVDRVGEGFKGIKLIDDWRASMAWAKEGLIILTGNFRFTQELDRYREFGYKIFAPTAASAALEIKRSLGMEAMKACGIECPPYQTFNSLEECLRFAAKSDDCWVFKTMGDEEDKSLSFVSKSPEQMRDWLHAKIRRGMRLKGPCMLQEKIDILAELGVSGWMGPEGFLPNRWQECWEHKKLMDHETGPQTGEMGTICQYVAESRLADEMLKPMESTLRVLGHRGDFAMGAAIDTRGRAWPLEFTSRCGWPAFFIQCASHKGDPAQWMRDLLDGKDSLRVDTRVAIGVVCAIPPFPHVKHVAAELVEGSPIDGCDSVMDDLHFAQVMIGKGFAAQQYQTAGSYVMCATALGASVDKARSKVYRTIDKIEMPDMMYRHDIGEKLKSPLPKLHSFGYALSTEYE